MKIKKTKQTVHHFFDQNVLEKISKAKPEYIKFQENFIYTFLAPNIKQVPLPFSLLEFAGIQSKNILKILYKGKKLNEYPCKYEELETITLHLRQQIEEKITKDFLKNKLFEKKNREAHYLSEIGIKMINEYSNYYLNDDWYNNLIYNLHLDRLTQINISKFSQKEKKDFDRYHFYPFIMRNICDEARTVGSLRAIKKMIDNICQEVKKQGIKDADLNKKRKRLYKISQNLELKSNADLVDCELIHLALFGYDNHYYHSYTTDKEDTIKKRLIFYCEGVLFMEQLLKEYYKHYLPNQRPKWKPSKIFILDKDTGEKITKISVTKIYEKIKNLK